MNVGFIGLGIMGSQMARHISNKGHNVCAWNRSKVSLENNNFTLVNSLNELVSNSEIIISCVSNEIALEEVYLGSNGILDSFKLNKNSLLKYIVDCSTVAPEFVKKLNETFLSENILFFDAPVTGGEVGATNGTLVSMVGGSEERLSEILPVIECYSKAIFHMGEVGAGQEAKCVNQIAIALGISAITESLFFAQQKGLPIDKMLEILQGGAAGSWAFNVVGPKILKDDFKPGFYARDMLKDLRIALKEAEKSLTPLPVTSLVKELYTSLLGKKGDKLGNHGLIEIYRELVEK